MADVRLKAPWSYLLIVVPLAVIALVIGIAVQWDWRAFIVPALFIVALVPYLTKRKSSEP